MHNGTKPQSVARARVAHGGLLCCLPAELQRVRLRASASRGFSEACVWQRHDSTLECTRLHGEKVY